MIRSKAQGLGGSLMLTYANALRSGALKWLRLAGQLIGLGATVTIVVLIVNSHSSSVLAGGPGAKFQVLGPMPGSFPGGPTFGSNLSADGSTIVGSAYVCPGGGTSCTSTGKTEAYRWTVAGGYEVLGDLEGSFGTSPGAFGSAAFAASSDGSVVVGDAPQGTNNFGAFRWTACSR